MNDEEILIDEAGEEAIPVKDKRRFNADGERQVEDKIPAEPVKSAYETALGRSVPLKEKPGFYFQRQCWISADPDEKALAYLIEYIGVDKFFWATDYPHDDHTQGYIQALEQLVAPLSERARHGLLGENVARVYGLAG